MSDTITVKVNAVGQSIEVNVPVDADVSDALDAAGVDAEAAALDVEVNGSDSVSSLSDGDQVTATPAKPKLG